MMGKPSLHYPKATAGELTSALGRAKSFRMSQEVYQKCQRSPIPNPKRERNLLSTIFIQVFLHVGCLFRNNQTKILCSL